METKTYVVLHMDEEGLKIIRSGRNPWPIVYGPFESGDIASEWIASKKLLEGRFIITDLIKP